MSTTKNERKYWQSLTELTESPELDVAVQDEFPNGLDSEDIGGPNRRHFMGIMGASMAMASMSGCVRRPVENIMPYAKMPEDVLPGVPSYYATTTHIAGDAIGLVVESNDGRPTKIEGNFEHPDSMGGINGTHQAMVLDLYDPARLRTPSKGKVPATWTAAEKFMKSHFGQLVTAGGAGLHVLSGANPSPTFDTLRRRFNQRLPKSSWYTYEPISYDNQRAGLKAAFGKNRRAVYSFSRARCVLSLDSDFLGTEQGDVHNARNWASLRDLKSNLDKMSRLYMVEGIFSLTGTNADHRLRLRTSQIEAFAFLVAEELMKDGLILPEDLRAAIKPRTASLRSNKKALKFAAAVAKDLMARQMRVGMATDGLVVAGRRQSALVHNLAAAINYFLSKDSGVVSYFDDPARDPADAGDMANITALTAALNAGSVKSLVILDSNPIYSAPGDVGFAAALAKAKTAGTQVICLADTGDETTKLADWVIPRAHFLEAWGDTVGSTGTLAIQQPVIEPLHGAWSEIEVLARMLGDEPTDGYTLVRNMWKRVYGATGFTTRWRQWLHDGKAIKPINYPQEGNPQHQGAGALLSTKVPSGKAAKDNLELVFVEDSRLYDGRFSNNSWLLECPDPITKIAWDNAALVSPKTAEALGIPPSSQIGKTETTRILLEVGGKNVEMPAWIVPGMADNTVVVAMGHGRDFASYLPYHDRGVVGFDVNPLRSVQSPDLLTGATISKKGGMYPIACLQRFGRQEPGFDFPKRALVREATLSEYQDDPTFAQEGIIQHGPNGAVVPKKTVRGEDTDYVVFHPPMKTPHDPPAKGADYSKGHQWAMVIDLNKCTGCNSCLVACVAENNIPSVGKEEARYGREMHWLRMDRYFVGDTDEPEVVHQPMLCSQCENAPCENVCPVQATAHSPEGLNDMAYNRCVGTRYCANNCPFKVRRFNFYNYTQSSSTWEGLKIRGAQVVDPNSDDELLHMVRNPDVTVRFRGVMEKCTYCIQRITRGKREASLAENALASRESIRKISTACQQSCPSDCITFGDINDKGNRLNEKRALDRNYQLLTELNLRTRTTYLAKVRNTNPALAAKKGG
jgi:MoCo/4Fe-4S cofactor protein with predicted Tat translocation signal